MSTPTPPDMVAPSPRVRVKDRCRRMMGDLRLSVIDQCNLRCRYCMPEEHYTWLPRQDLLSVKEISAIVDVFLSVGVSKVRITGGEPLIRPDLPEIVRTLSAKVGEDSGPEAHIDWRAPYHVWAKAQYVHTVSQGTRACSLW
nr:radical SAM protein [Mycobacterium tuberculosis]